MQYVSTRGQAPALSFEDVLLTGLAPDGGLYVPEAWPALSPEAIRALRGLDFPSLAVAIMRPFVGETFPGETLDHLVHGAYRRFDHRAVAPLKMVGPNQWLMELFHGPTLAFKDYALQVVGEMFDHVLARRGSRLTILGATSGDTGSAAIEACRDRENVDIFILHPKDRVSEVQRRQMTTVDAPNVFNIAIEGNFDDCQDLVKAAFADETFRAEQQLSAVNSINWARIMAQIVYYIHAGLAVGAPDRPVAFAVPTGNFGNVYAGNAARAMGLPVTQLVVGSNSNDILTRFFATGEMSLAPVVSTLSPSMDIQVSSNFERLLFELYDRDGAVVRDLLGRLRQEGRFQVAEERWRQACQLFDGLRQDDEQTRLTIAETLAETGELIDPHSAIGVAAGRQRARRRDVPMVALATAHPAKFPDAVESATGRRPALPSRLQAIMTAPEHYAVLPAEADAVKQYVRTRGQA